MSLAPQLTTFAENAITAIFQATDKKTFDAAFDSFVATHPTSIVVNGETLSREQYHDKLWDTKFLEAGAQVQFLGAVGNPPGFGKAGGEVGVFVQAVIDEKLLVLGAPETRTVTVSMNLTIKNDPTHAPPDTHGIRGIPFEGRRVFALTSVSTTDPTAVLLPLPNPINPGGPKLPPTTAASS